MLEKRVKSRFSHRQLHVVPVAAPVLNDSSLATGTNYKDNEEDDEMDGGAGGGRGPFKRYCTLAASLLKISNRKALMDFVASHPEFCRGGGGASSKKRKLTDAMDQWNAHVDDFFDDELVTDCLRQTWEVSTCIGKLRSFIVSDVFCPCQLNPWFNINICGTQSVGVYL